MDHPSVFTTRDVATLSAAEIMALFDWYEFTDPIGHDLTACVPFRRLVELATGETLPFPQINLPPDPPPPPPTGPGEADG